MLYMRAVTITGLRRKQNNTMQMLQPKNPSKNRLDLHLANWTDCIITDMPFGQYDYVWIMVYNEHSSMIKPEANLVLVGLHCV